MPDYKINDDWILTRISSQSSSFKQWVTNLLKDVEKSLEQIPVDVRKKVKIDKEIANLKDLDKDIASFQRHMENLSPFGKKFPNFGYKLMNRLQKPIEMGFKSSLKELDINGDIEFGFLTGKRKNLSSALYDVSKERGIEAKGLLYLIKALPDLEAFLYSTSVKKYYRDHTEHALRVAVLGDFLLEQDLGQGTLEGIISELLDLDKKILKDKFWWITGLFHDIGYPLGKMTTAINYSLLNQLLKCYPTLDLEFTPFEINLNWQGLQEEYLKIIEKGLSKEAKELIRKGSGFYLDEPPRQDLQKFLAKPEGHPEYDFNSSVRLDHGVISSLSLLKSLGTPEDLTSNDEFDGYIKVAQAIALHNFKSHLKEYIFDNQPLAFFLMLIDELQEWGRPIPIQIRDSYFTVEVKKINLLEEVTFILDEFKWLMQFKNQQAKKLMKFDFQFFSNDKKRAFGRLDNGEHFPTTTITLQDIKSSSQKKKKKEEIIAQEKIII
ncbi:MAG: hypothetical protein ACFFA0_05640 [Promethearchaeota archaeon]